MRGWPGVVRAARDVGIFLPPKTLRARLATVRMDRAAPAIVVAWVLLLYGWTLGFAFINDDYTWIAGARVIPGRSWLNAALVPPFWSGNFVRPLVQLSFFVNHLCGGVAPFGYHLVNVLLEAANTYLVLRLAHRLLADRSAALLVALLFAVQPAHAEAVTWVSARTELLAATFFLSALLAHCARRVGVAALLFALALLSKESAASFLLVALLADRFASDRARWRWGAFAAYVAVLLAYLPLRAVLTARFAVGLVGLHALRAHQFDAALRLITLRFAQAAQLLWVPLQTSGRQAVALLVGVFAVALWGSRDRRARGTVWLSGLWVPSTLAPYLALWATQPRYLYLATVGFAVLLVRCGYVLWNRLGGDRWWRVAVGAAAGVWVMACVAALQRANDLHRRNAVMSTRVINALVRAVPHPAPGTVFLVSGLGPWRYGFGPLPAAILMYGLADALRLRFDDPTLDVSFSEPPANAPPPRGHPRIGLHWNGSTETFEPVAPKVG
jgi:hypothetical protein